MKLSNDYLYKRKQLNSSLLVFIHGASGDYTLWSNINRYYFNKGFSTLAINLPGHGKSKLKPFTSIEENSNFIRNIIKKFKYKSVILIGHSMGCLICLDLALNSSLKLKKIILIGASYPMNVSNQLLEDSKNSPEIAVNSMINWGIASHNIFGGCNNSGLYLPNILSTVMNKNAQSTLYNDLMACRKFILPEEKFDQIDVHTEIVSGEKDIMTPLSGAESLKKKLSSANLSIINECGHFHMQEKQEELRDIITNILNGK